MNQQFTEAMQKTLSEAASMAMNLNQQVVDVDHFVYAALEDKSGFFYRVLSRLDVNINNLMDDLNNNINNKPSVAHVSENDLHFSYDMNNLLGEANKVMKQYKDEYLSMEHVLVGLFNMNSTSVQNMLHKYNLNKKEVEKVIKDICLTESSELKHYGQNAVFVSVSYALILSEEVPDFSAAYADIAGGNVHVRSYVAVKFSHKGLAKTHYFRVAFAARVKVGTALSSAHRESCKAVFKGLFES